MNVVWMCLFFCAVFTPLLLAAGSQLITVDDKVQYHLIGIGQTWLSVSAGVYMLALVFRRRQRRLATAAVVWLSKPVLLLFALQLYTLGIGINHCVIVVCRGSDCIGAGENDRT